MSFWKLSSFDFIKSFNDIFFENRIFESFLEILNCYKNVTNSKIFKSFLKLYLIQKLVKNSTNIRNFLKNQSFQMLFRILS